MAELTMEEIEAKRKEYEGLIAKGEEIAAELMANGVEVQSEMEAEGKPWYESKMFWANAVALGGIGLTVAGVAPEQATMILSGVVALVTIYLRSRSVKQPLKLRK